MVEQKFRHFYLRWKTELNRDRKEASAKSSLYRFKGQHLDEEETKAEDLEELFPTTDATLNGTAVVRSAQDLGHSIAACHYRIFEASQCNEATMTDILYDWLRLAPSTSIEGTEASLPGLLLALGDADSRLTSEEGNRNYNIYRDANVAEAQKLLQLALERQSSLYSPKVNLG